MADDKDGTPQDVTGGDAPVECSTCRGSCMDGDFACSACNGSGNARGW